MLLEELLKGPPSRRAFAEILDAFVHWNAVESLSVWLSRAADALVAWDDEEREAGVRLVWPTFPAGEPHPCFVLLRGLRARKRRIGDDGARALAALPLLSSLRLLDISENGIGAIGLRALAHSPHLASLSALILKKNHLDARALSALQGHAFSSLVELDLSQCGIDDRGMATLAQVAADGGLPRLTSLIVQDNEIGDDGIRALLSSPLAARLEKLNLRKNALSRVGVQCIADASHMKAIDKLYLSKNEVGVEGVASLVDATQLQSLSVLTLSHCEIGDEGASLLAGARRMTRLQTLHISDNGIGPLGMKVLCEAPQLGCLKALYAYWNKLGAEGAEALAAATFAKQLSLLELADNQIGDEGLIALARADMGELALLDLKQNGIGDRGLEALSQSQTLHALRLLRLDDNGITDVGGLALARALREQTVAGAPLRALRRLSLRRNRLGHDVAIAFATSPCGGEMDDLDMTENELGEDGVKQLAFARHLAPTLRRRYMLLCPRHTLVSQLKERGITTRRDAKKQHLVAELLAQS